jgi:polysaccharide biosynthesis PFTS motif protein
MIKSVVSKYFYLIKRKKLRRAMRGYRYLKNENRLDEISNIKRDLAAQRIDGESLCPSKYIYGAGLANAETIIRQYMAVHFSNHNLNRKLLCFYRGKNTKIIHPIPKQWESIFDNYNIKVNKVLCEILWNIYIFIFLMYGITSIIKINLLVIFSFFKSSDNIPTNYAYFPGLSGGNFCANSNSGKNYDLMTWYEKWDGHVADIDTIYHDVIGISEYKINNLSVKYLPSLFTYRLTLLEFLRYLSWSISACLISVLDFFRGRWCNPLLLNEASKAALVRIQNKKLIAKEYMFGTTGVIYRPLWTYEAENKGSNINLYFYSVNSGGWKTESGYPDTAPGWSPMSWSRYLVWDKYQADFVYREVGDSAIVSIVGPVWFCDCNKQVDETDRLSIAVFDVQPHRDSRFQMLGSPHDYYRPATAKQFLSDINLIASKWDAKILLKRKRDIGKLLHPEYKTLVSEISESDNFKLIDTCISAIKVIEKCDVIISMPFTSTAILGKEMSKPSIYYDSTGMFHKDDRCGHGIEIISGINELELWFEKSIRASEKTVNTYTI